MMVNTQTLKTESKKLREKEILENFKVLSADGQIQLVMLSRKLKKQENEKAQFEKFMCLAGMLDKNAKRELAEYMEALAQDPRYRKEDYETQA